MSTFIYRGPLRPDSPLFKGRNAEMSRLVAMCSSRDVDTYGILYSGHQTGKTTLLKRLESTLPSSMHICRLDFQGTPRASTPRVYTRLLESVFDSVGIRDQAAPVEDATEMAEYLSRALDRPSVSRYVLLIEELGSLPIETRWDLANAFRYIFSNRGSGRLVPLLKLAIILAGGNEVFNLAFSETSTLHNVCEDVYLSDLEESDAVSLVGEGLVHIGLAAGLAGDLAREVYRQVQGHPYLTQRLGSYLEQAWERNETLNVELIPAFCRKILEGDSFVRHLVAGLDELGFDEDGRELLDGSIPFDRVNEAAKTQLELLGVAGERNGRWTARNPLIATCLQSWLKGRQPH